MKNLPRYGSTGNALAMSEAKDLAASSVAYGPEGARMSSLGAGLEVGEDGLVFLPR